MKQTEHRPVVPLSEARLEWLLRQASYRTQCVSRSSWSTGRPVQRTRATLFVRDAVSRWSGNCALLRPCGQRLNWKGCKYAKVIR